MGERHVKPDRNKKIIYMDATDLYGHSMIKPLPYDEIEMWHGHPELFMNKLDKILQTPDGSDIGYFVEIDIKYPDNKKEKTRLSHFVLKEELFPKKLIMII